MHQVFGSGLGQRQIGMSVLRASLCSLTLLVALLPGHQVMAMADPAPSPLYQQSLQRSVAGMNTVIPPQPAAAEEAGKWIARSLNSPPSEVASVNSPIIRDCFNSDGRFIMSPQPTDMNCEFGGPVQVSGPTTVERVGPP